MKNNISLEKLVNDLGENGLDSINESSGLIVDLENKLKKYSIKKKEIAILADNLSKIFSLVKSRVIEKEDSLKNKFIENCSSEDFKDLSKISDLSLGEILDLSEHGNILVDKNKKIMWKVTKENHGTKDKEDIVTIAIPHEDKKKYPEYNKANFEIWNGALEYNVKYRDLTNISKV